MIDFKKLPIHHIGIAMDVQEFKQFTENLKINNDKIQGVQTYFEYNQHLKCYLEYFTLTGRASNYSSGYNHICYSLKNYSSFLGMSEYLKKNRMGVQLTELEQSGSSECNKVVFFYLKKFGIVEFNVIE